MSLDRNVKDLETSKASLKSRTGGFQHQNFIGVDFKQARRYFSYNRPVCESLSAKLP